MNNIKRLLVANRGEIAIRVFRAASELKIQTIALYTYEDRYSLHRYKADEAYQIGNEEEPLKPYLDIEEIIKLAKKKKVDAIHPGYGFLSENVEFAKRCGEEGILFVGPKPEVMERLGDKIKAKKVAQLAQVPIIEGSSDFSNPEQALEAAKKIGFPVILKAAAGGGGRGMRVIHDPATLKQSYSEASNEALKAFGDGTVFIEKYVEDPKHIEVQLLGDNHGNLVHLYERDCSVQRRFQKVVEVAPSTGLKEETRNKLYQYAVAIGQEVNYANAGTVEFLVDKNESIYFIEVNPRIQVEHTITEEITGIDIVRSQLHIADGKKLSDRSIFIKNQEDVSINGFAIQCRITTEDPKDDFKPDYGTIIAYRNAAGMGIRLDEGSSYPGVKISPFFDSMLVKVSAWGRTLNGASERLERTLREFKIRGVKNNISFLRNVIGHPVFKEGEQRVSFIQDHPELMDFTPSQDRGTRTLNYLADVIVNGNSDVKFIDPSKEFRFPKVPLYDRHSAHTPGTKNLLTELGPGEFSKWMRQENRVLYTDTTFRDAHQSLLATRVRTTDLMTVAESFAKNHPEIFSMEIWGGATFDVCLRFLKEDPWLRLKLLREAMPNVLTQMLIRASNAVGYKAYPDNLVEKFIEKSWETGVDIFRVFDSLNWTESLKHSTKAVLERTNGLAEVCLCYTGDISNPAKTKYNLDYYLDLARQIEDMGAHILGIKDMAGLLKPEAAHTLVTELRKAVDIPIHLHTHDTAGIQVATYLNAVNAGVDAVDVSLSSMSGLTSQPNFNSFVALMENHPREQKLNLSRLNEFSNYWEDIREWYYPFESELKAGTAQVYNHEIPGGQYSNLRPQARGLGIEHKFEEIKTNYQIANEIMGDLVKVTPSSKVVGDMAMFMTTNGYTKEDIMKRGQDISFPDTVIGFFKGELGQPYGGFPEELRKIVLKNEKGFSDRPNAHLEPVDFDSEFEAFKTEFGQEHNFLDFLSFKLYPKVFKDYHEFSIKNGEVWRIPTLAFFYGMKQNQEILVELDAGKTILVRFLNVSAPDENGMRQVYFKLNGQNRFVEVKDHSLNLEVTSNKKAENEGDVGAPLQGKLIEILVEKGQQVEKNDPLFVIEAMKMESTVVAPFSGVIDHVELDGNKMVKQDDLVVTLA
mgnify:CR=1 FL=1